MPEHKLHAVDALDRPKAGPDRFLPWPGNPGRTAVLHDCEAVGAHGFNANQIAFIEPLQLAGAIRFARARSAKPSDQEGRCHDDKRAERDLRLERSAEEGRSTARCGAERNSNEINRAEKHLGACNDKRGYKPKNRTRNHFSERP